MSNAQAPVKEESCKTPSSEIKKRVENHKMEAAKYYHETGNHEKAALNAIIARSYHALAHEIQKEDTKKHAFLIR